MILQVKEGVLMHLGYLFSLSRSFVEYMMNVFQIGVNCQDASLDLIFLPVVLLVLPIHYQVYFQRLLLYFIFFSNFNLFFFILLFLVAESQAISKFRGICFYDVTSFVAIFLFVLLVVAHPFVFLFDKYRCKAQHFIV